MLEMESLVERCLKRFKEIDSSSSAERKTSFLAHMDRVLKLTRQSTDELSIEEVSKKITSNDQRYAFVDECNEKLSQETHDLMALHDLFRQDDSFLTDLYNECNTKNSADMQIMQDIKGINERNLEAALSLLTKSHDHCQDQFVQLIATGENVVVRLGSDFTKKVHKVREEIRSEHNCEDVLGSGIEIRYQYLRDTYLEILKRSYFRTDAKVKDWISIEHQRFEWAKEKIDRSIQNYSLGDRSKRMSYHAKVNERERAFSDFALQIASKSLSPTKERQNKDSVQAWKSKIKNELETWLSTTVGFMESTIDEHLFLLEAELSMLKRSEMRLRMEDRRLHHLSRMSPYALGEATTRESPGQPHPVLGHHLPHRFGPPRGTGRNVMQSGVAHPQSSEGEHPSGSFSSLRLGTHVNQLCDVAAIPINEQEELLMHILFG